MGDAISSLLFQPPPPTYLHPSRHFWLQNSLGHRIPAFFIERPNALVTILFSHGNAEDLGMIYDWFNDLARVLRVNIMAYDYTGYGKSSSNGGGTGGGGGVPPSEQQCYADIESAFQYLLQVRKVQPEQIVLYGRSLGSGPSCYLASKTAKEGRSVGGVILQSPLLSAYRVAFNFRFTMMGDKFPNVDYAPAIRCPVFIVHGTQDEVVPFWHGEDLFMALPQAWRAKPFWVEGAGHNNIEALLRPTGAFVEKLLEFLDLHVSARRGVIAPPRRVPECVPTALRELQHEQNKHPPRYHPRYQHHQHQHHQHHYQHHKRGGGGEEEYVDRHLSQSFSSSSSNQKEKDYDSYSHHTSSNATPSHNSLSPSPGENNHEEDKRYMSMGNETTEVTSASFTDTQQQNEGGERSFRVSSHHTAISGEGSGTFQPPSMMVEDTTDTDEEVIKEAFINGSQQITSKSSLLGNNSGGTRSMTAMNDGTPAITSSGLSIS